MDKRFIEDLKIFIKNRESFRIGVRGICVDVRWDRSTMTWIVDIPRAFVSLRTSAIGFDETEEHLVMRNMGMLCLHEFSLVKRI